jgi:hypothetical protein
MKPSQIRVFDGLRISTDHVNHLQDAVASGFEDFRLILGLGRAQTGLAVTVVDDGTVTIQPGVAFDQQKNRVACDDPLTLKVTFGAQDTMKFVCLKYVQIDDSAVEGHPTMIWDSCSALVRDTYPDPTENLVTLAKITRSEDGKMHVCAPHERNACPCGRDWAGSLAPASPAAAVVGSIPAPVVTSDVVPADALPADPPPEPAPVVEAAGGNASPAAPAALPVAPNPVQSRQGVIQLASDSSAASYLRLVVAPALRAKFGSDAIDLSFSLGQIELTPDISATSFTTHSVLSGGLLFPAVDTSPQTQFAFDCVSQGEATASESGLAQFAASSFTVRPVPAPPGTVWPAAALTGRGLLEFPFANWAAAPDGSRPPLSNDVLAGLALVARLTPKAQGFVFDLGLLWNGKVSDDSLKVLETLDIQLTWQINFGWKAVGN